MGSEFQPKRIAIIGSGVSGLGALYSLKDSGHEIHLFEKDSRLGGHTNTLQWTDNQRDVSCAVDTGFIVMNTSTYPNFLAFLKEMKIKPTPTAMTFSISRNFGEYEWSGEAPFCQLSNFVSLQHWRMLFDYIRFNAFATDILRSPDCDQNTMTLDEYLELHSYSKAFRDNYLLPLTACVWSTGPEKCALDFPAVTLIRFMMNHNLLYTLTKRPDWLTIQGGARQYIDALLEDFPPEQIYTSKGVKSVATLQAIGQARRQVRVDFEDGDEQLFDEVILACHGDQALRLLGSEVTTTEKKILSAFKTTPNIAYLHSDRQLLPARPAAWSAWNYQTTPSTTTVSLTYNMNILQHIPTATYSDILVSLNPPFPPHPDTVQATIPYAHPMYTNEAVSAQKRLVEIQGTRGIWYVGAWTGYGFHEDGFVSGIVVGGKLGGRVNWEIEDLRHKKVVPGLGMGEMLGRMIIRLVFLLIQFCNSVLLFIRGGSGITQVNGESKKRL